MAIPYERIVAEDLDRGYGSVTVTMPAGGSATGQQVGLHTWTDVFNVKDFGAAGDGVMDDTAAIQAAITAAKTIGVAVRDSGGTDTYIDHDRVGGVIYFPPGRYMVSAPIVLPRSGSYVAWPLTLCGVSQYTCTIAAMAAFPPNRGLIEWDAVAKRVSGQTITRLGLDCNNTNARCIWFTPTNKATWVAIDAESMYEMTFSDLVCFANNTTTQVLIKIEGRIDYSRITNIKADCVLGVTPTYSTVLLQLDSDLLGTPAYARLLDYPGFNFGSIDGLRQGLQGGKNTMLDGRVSHSTIAHIHHGIGSLSTAPGVHLKNGGLLVLTEWDFEGNAEDPELWIENCTEVFAVHIQASPTEGGAGTGIKITNSSFIRIIGHGAIAGYTSFHATGGKMIRMDALSDHCRFEAIGGNDFFVDEIEWLSPGNLGNYIEYFFVPNANERTVKDENLSAVLRATATLDTSLIAGDGTNLQIINVPGALPGAEVLVGYLNPTDTNSPFAPWIPGVVLIGAVQYAGLVYIFLHNTRPGAVTPAGGQTISVRVFNP